MSIHAPTLSQPQSVINQTLALIKPHGFPPVQDTIHFSGALRLQQGLTFEDRNKRWVVTNPVDGTISSPESFTVLAEVNGNVESTKGSLDIKRVKRKGYFALGFQKVGKAVNATAKTCIELSGELSGDAVSQEDYILIYKGGKAVNATAKTCIELSGELSGDAVSQEDSIKIHTGGKAVNATAKNTISLSGELTGDITLTGSYEDVGAPVLFFNETGKLGGKIIFANPDNDSVPGLIVHPNHINLEIDESLITGKYTIMSRNEYEALLLKTRLAHQ